MPGGSANHRRSSRPIAGNGHAGNGARRHRDAADADAADADAADAAAAAVDAATAVDRDSARGAGGGPAPTIYDVASRAGVSIATVSRVLNEQDTTRPATRQKVLDAMQELGYEPDGAARGLSRRHKRILALLFAHLPTDDQLMSEEELALLFTDSVIRGAEWSANRLGYSLLLSGVPSGTDDPLRSVRAIAARADGLMLFDRVLPDRRIEALAARVPVIMLAGSGRVAGAVTVRVDNAGGMRALADHLVNGHGRRRAAFVSGYTDSPDSASRAKAFAKAVTELGGTCEPATSMVADWTSSGAAEAVRRRLQSGEPLPEAIACANDQMAIGVMHALSGAGVRVPEDVAVTGFDDIQIARYLAPPLTTVRQPARELGAAAVEALVERIEGTVRRPRETVLPVQLVVRQSCGCPAGTEAS